MMRKRNLIGAFLFAVCALWACTTTPYTQLGIAAYEEVLKKAPVTRDPAVVGVVERVGQRIARVAAKPEYQWEFTVIDDPKTVNAFALPGGKVAVYTGLFPVAKDEAGLAAVMGHEVAHALARHGGERVSQGLMLQIAAVGVGAAVGGGNPQTANAVMQAFGLGAQVGVVLPFGRSQESEADHIGMILMAKAGYDPGAALTLWQRMEQSETGGRPPEWLSTHPSAGTRQQQITAWLPEVRKYYAADPSVKNQPLPSIK
jgi:predicted Zn-dependent protease